VLDDGEDPGSERVLAAAGHSATVSLHAMYEWAPGALAGVPRGAEWKAMIEEVPEPTRHLAVHELHLVGVSDHDRPFVGPELLAAVGFTPAQLRERLDQFAGQGVTEIVYQPAGPDIGRELATFAEAAAG